MSCRAWRALQERCNELVGTPRDDVVDVRDPLLDLTTCPTCGTDLSKETTRT